MRDHSTNKHSCIHLFNEHLLIPECVPGSQSIWSEIYTIEVSAAGLRWSWFSWASPVNKHIKYVTTIAIT